MKKRRRKITKRTVRKKGKYEKKTKDKERGVRKKGKYEKTKQKTKDNKERE